MVFGLSSPASYAAAITRRTSLQGWKSITKNVLQTNESLSMLVSEIYYVPGLDSRVGDLTGFYRFKIEFQSG